MSSDARRCKSAKARKIGKKAPSKIDAKVFRELRSQCGSAKAREENQQTEEMDGKTYSTAEAMNAKINDLMGNMQEKLNFAEREQLSDVDKLTTKSKSSEILEFDPRRTANSVAFDLSDHRIANGANEMVVGNERLLERKTLSEDETQQTAPLEKSRFVFTLSILTEFSLIVSK